MTEKGLTLLTNLTAAEVSLVKRGANLKKRFPIFKSKEEDQTMGKTTEEILTAVLATEVEGEAALFEEISKAGLSDGAVAAAKAALRAIASFKEEFPPDVIAKLVAAAGYPYPKPGEGYPSPKPVEGACTTPDDKKKEEEMKKSFEAVIKSREDEIATLKKANEEIAKSLQDERSARAEADWIAKAKDELSHYPGESSEALGKTLKALSDKDPEIANKLFADMKKVSEVLKGAPAFRETPGATSIQGSGTETSAIAEMEKLVAGLVEKDAGLTKEKAFAKIVKMYPALYERYLKENPKQVQG